MDERKIKITLLICELLLIFWSYFKLWHIILPLFVPMDLNISSKELVFLLRILFSKRESSWFLRFSFFLRTVGKEGETRLWFWAICGFVPAFKRIFITKYVDYKVFLWDLLYQYTLLFNFGHTLGKAKHTNLTGAAHNTNELSVLQKRTNSFPSCFPSIGNSQMKEAYKLDLFPLKRINLVMSC